MGEGVLGHISKGIVLTKVDAVVNHTAAGRFDLRADLLADLKASNTPQDYREVLERVAKVTTSESNYLGAKWYEPGGWWPNHEAAFGVVLRGLIKAIELAGADLPVDSYWLPVAPPGVIEVSICKSARQVTRIILTPPSEPPVHDRPAQRDMWVVKSKLESDRTGLATKDEVVESVDRDTVTWRVRDTQSAADWRLLP